MGKKSSNFDELFRQLDRKAEASRKNMFNKNDETSASMERSQLANMREYKKVCGTCKEADMYFTA
jgi:hypothetical protein